MASDIWCKTIWWWKKAIKGTTIGLLVGIFILPFGIILGPFIGALLGAFLENKDNSVLSPIKVASGALIGFFGGVFLKIFVTFYIIIEVLNKAGIFSRVLL